MKYAAGILGKRYDTKNQIPVSYVVIGIEKRVDLIFHYSFSDIAFKYEPMSFYFSGANELIEELEKIVNGTATKDDDGYRTVAFRNGVDKVIEVSDVNNGDVSVDIVANPKEEKNCFILHRVWVWTKKERIKELLEAMKSVTE